MYLVSPSPSKRRPDPQRNQMLAGLVVQVARSEARKCTVRRVDWRAIHHNTESIVSAIEHVVHHGLDVVRLSRLIETAQLCGGLCQLVETEAERRQEKASLRTRRTDFG